MKATVETLQRLDPLCVLPAERLAELVSYCVSETIAPDDDPFQAGAPFRQSVYVVQGALDITYADGYTERVAPREDSPQRPIGHGRQVLRGRALETSELLRVDDDLIDIMVTWSQAEALTGAGPGGAHVPAWSLVSGAFGVDTLTAGVFSNLPPAHIAELLHRFEPLPVARGQVVIREGDPGDFYYVIESGRARVTRQVGGTEMPLADLKSGDAFGEEALLAQGKRNATVSMKTDGRLLRLSKGDFDALLRKPLLAEVSFAEAQTRVAAGAQWVDVRFPSEYQHDRIQGAINVPLGELRHALHVLDRNVEYIAYCQSGRRSAAAAFLLAQRGYRAAVLANGLWSARPAA